MKLIKNTTSFPDDVIRRILSAATKAAGIRQKHLNFITIRNTQVGRLGTVDGGGSIVTHCPTQGTPKERATKLYRNIFVLADGYKQWLHSCSPATGVKRPIAWDSAKRRAQVAVNKLTEGQLHDFLRPKAEPERVSLTAAEADAIELRRKKKLLHEWEDKLERAERFTKKYRRIVRNLERRIERRQSDQVRTFDFGD